MLRILAWLVMAWADPGVPSAVFAPSGPGFATGNFRDLVSGARGKPGMGRIISDLWASYPDLSVSVEGQQTEGDLVRPRLTISGTDRGGGVMWYSPTSRRVSFGAEFADRFSGGLLVEHAKEADTVGLLRQLGH